MKNSERQKEPIECITFTPFTESNVGEVHKWIESDNFVDIHSAFGSRIFSTKNYEINEKFMFSLLHSSPSANEASHPNEEEECNIPMMITIRTSYHKLLNIGFVHLVKLANTNDNLMENDCLIKHLYIGKGFRLKEYEYKSIQKLVEYVLQELGYSRCIMWVYENNYLFLSILRTLNFKLVRTYKPEKDMFNLTKYCFKISTEPVNIVEPDILQNVTTPKRHEKSVLNEQNMNKGRGRGKQEYYSNREYKGGVIETTSHSPRIRNKQNRQHKQEKVLPDLQIPNFLSKKEKLQSINRVHELRSIRSLKQSVGWYSPAMSEPLHIKSPAIPSPLTTTKNHVVGLRGVNVGRPERPEGPERSKRSTKDMILGKREDSVNNYKIEYNSPVVPRNTLNKSIGIQHSITMEKSESGESMSERRAVNNNNNNNMNNHPKVFNIKKQLNTLPHNSKKGRNCIQLHNPLNVMQHKSVDGRISSKVRNSIDDINSKLLPPINVLYQPIIIGHNSGIDALIARKKIFDHNLDNEIKEGIKLPITPKQRISPILSHKMRKPLNTKSTKNTGATTPLKMIPYNYNYRNQNMANKNIGEGSTPIIKRFLNKSKRPKRFSTFDNVHK